MFFSADFSTNLLAPIMLIREIAANASAALIIIVMYCIGFVWFFRPVFISHKGNDLCQPSYVLEATKKLILKTNTITPLLKRIEHLGLIIRTRSAEDERKVLVQLTEKGLELQVKAAQIPDELVKRFPDSEIELDDLIKLTESLNSIISVLSK